MTSRLGESPFFRPAAGMLLGPVLAVAALAADGAELVPPDSAAILTANARAFIASVVVGAITITALVFWVRGMLVQLSAGQFSPRLLRWYLGDRFLQSTIGLVLASFSYGSVVLLWLPGEATRPAPFLAVIGAFLLTASALMAVVVTIVNSVRRTQESHVLSVLTDDAIATIRRRYPPAGSQRRATAVEPPHDAAQTAVMAAVSGWVNDIDEDALLASVPAGAHLRVHAHSGMFVAEGSTLASLHGYNATPSDVARLQASFTVDTRRSPQGDVELALGRLGDAAIGQLGADSTGRTGGHEALMHLSLALKELFNRDEEDVLVRDGDRSVEWVARLSHGDLLAWTLSPLRESGKVTSTVAVTMLRGLGMVARDLRTRDGRDPRIELLEREARFLLAELPGDQVGPGGTSDPFHVAEEEGLTARPRRVPSTREG